MKWVHVVFSIVSVVVTQLLALIIFLSLVGCTPTPKHDKFALATLNNLRDKFNRKQCATIYGESDSGFQKVMSLSEWSSQCRGLQETVGYWSDLTGVSVQPLPDKPDILLIAGRATFQKGVYRLESYWKMTHNHAYWYLLSLTKPAVEICIPSCPKTDSNNKLQDPPIHFKGMVQAPVV